MKTLFYFSLIAFLFVAAGPGFSQNHTTATGKAYFDMATGHKYIQNSDNTYTEYSKKGKLLRNDVPNTQPLLTRGKYITELKADHYLVYEKNQNNIVAQQVLPATSKHPEGYKCMMAVEKMEAGSAEAYESSEIKSLQEQ